MFLYLGRITGIIVAGGVGRSVVNFLTGDLGIKQLPTLPQNIDYSSMVAHNGTILLCGGFGNLEKCLQLDNGTWKEHSTLNRNRIWHSAVTTEIATFSFGGLHSKTNYEYLPNNSSAWIMGRTKIPGGFMYGCAIAVKSEQEIWLIGGCDTEKRILSFDVESHTFQVLPFQLNVGRHGHRCAFIPNTNKIMITGGYNGSNVGYEYLDSTEILDTEDGTVTMANPMNTKRTSHGMGVLTINGEERLAVIGGHYGYIDTDIVELYNTQRNEWEIADFKLNQGIEDFGVLTVKLSDVISHL